MGERAGRRHRREGFVATGALLALHLSAGCSPGASPLAGPSAASVTEISMERDCFGCATGSLLVLRREGTANYTITGKARHGTVDQQFRGVAREEDFDRLARSVVSRGFFELNDRYEDPELRDGEWTSTTADRDGRKKTVLHRNHAGPPNLEEIEKAIDAARAAIDWVPAGGR